MIRLVIEVDPEKFPKVDGFGFNPGADLTITKVQTSGRTFESNLKAKVIGDVPPAAQ